MDKRKLQFKTLDNVSTSVTSLKDAKQMFATRHTMSRNNKISHFATQLALNTQVNKKEIDAL